MEGSQMSTAFFYFALTAEESLTVSPYNQPVEVLEQRGIKVYSVDLPFHVIGAGATASLEHWLEAFRRNENILEPFFAAVRAKVDGLIREGEVDPNKMAIGGLSRGAFVATHVAARDERWKAVLGFAPLTRLTGGLTFAPLKGQPLAEGLALHELTDQLAGRPLRYYIGNRDELVGTAHCFHFVEGLVEACHRRQIRPAPVELIITPSVGRLGHGTLPHTFHEGAHWIADQLESL
jgi:dienelactone hydrolase